MADEYSHDITDPDANRQAGLTADSSAFRKRLVLQHPACEIAAIGHMFFVSAEGSDDVIGFNDPDAMADHLRALGLKDADIREALARPAPPGAVRET